MSKRKSKGAKRAKRSGAKLAELARKGKTIFEALPKSARTGRCYYDVLCKLGVPSGEAKTIAGEWLLDKMMGGPEGEG